MQFTVSAVTPKTQSLEWIASLAELTSEFINKYNFFLLSLKGTN